MTIVLKRRSRAVLAGITISAILISPMDAQASPFTWQGGSGNNNGGGPLAVGSRSGTASAGINSIGSLSLSPGSETDFRLFGAGGGSSDRINVLNQFTYSSAGTYNIGFAYGDSLPLTPGTTFTLVTFGSTTFTDASAFRPVVSTGSGGTGGLGAINGTFALVPANSATGTPGSLQFTLISATSMPEPPSGILPLLLVGPGLLMQRWRSRRRAK